MKAIRIHQRGGPENLVYEDAPIPKLQNGDALVRVYSMAMTEHEDLGTQFIESVETLGTRDRVIYNPWVFGNDQILTVEREYWYSPKLGINLLSIVSDRRIGQQTFRATEIVTSEPDPSLFTLPAGFKVVAPTHPPQSEQSATNEE